MHSFLLLLSAHPSMVLVVWTKRKHASAACQAIYLVGKTISKGKERHPWVWFLCSCGSACMTHLGQRDRPLLQHICCCFLSLFLPSAIPAKAPTLCLQLLPAPPLGLLLAFQTILFLTPHNQFRHLGIRIGSALADQNSLSCIPANPHVCVVALLVHPHTPWNGRWTD